MLEPPLLRAVQEDHEDRHAGGHEAEEYRAIAAEQTRLADALHDGPLTQLVLLRLAVQASIPDPAARAAVLGRLDRVTQSLHDLTAGWHEDSLADRTLRESLELIAQPMRAGTRVDVRVDAAAEGLEDAIMRHAVRELLCNAVRHAGPTAVGIELRREDAALVLRVRDDGTGMDPRALAGARTAGHLGHGRLERIAARRGGEFSVAPAEPTGTVVTLRLPIPDRRQAADGSGP